MVLKKLPRMCHVLCSPTKMGCVPCVTAMVVSSLIIFIVGMVLAGSADTHISKIFNLPSTKCPKCFLHFDFHTSDNILNWSNFMIWGRVPMIIQKRIPYGTKNVAEEFVLQ